MLKRSLSYLKIVQAEDKNKKAGLFCYVEAQPILSKNNNI